MKYWGYFLAKLLVVFAAVGLLNLAIVHFLPLKAGRSPNGQPLFLSDMAYTFEVIGVWFVRVGLLSLAVVDQRRRCRTCLRRLIMPIATGSWGNILTIGRPQTEWICPYGHGTLRIDELQITGKEAPDWKSHGDDIWKELESYGARK